MFGTFIPCIYSENTSYCKLFDKAKFVIKNPNYV